MKVGSLVECVKKNWGIGIYHGEEVQFLNPIEIGEIRTVEEILKRYNLKEGYIDCVILKEDPLVFHPGNGELVARDIRCFSEIQPPMDIKIEDIISEPVTQ